MPYVDPEIIAEVKRVDLLTYLQEREPDELVRISPGVYCTKEHDSLKISNGKWFWWSRDLGGSATWPSSTPWSICGPTALPLREHPRPRMPPHRRARRARRFASHAGAPTTMRCGTSNRAASRAAC